MAKGGRDPERSLVAFTVLVQAGAGLCIARACARLLGGPREAAHVSTQLALVLLVLGAIAAWLHLARRGAARFALSNLRFSWLSREVLLGLTLSLLTALLIVFDRVGPAPAALVFAMGLLAVSFVHAITRIYRLRTVPAWDTWRTPAAFFLTGLLLGGAFHALMMVAAGTHRVDELRRLCLVVAALALVQVFLFALHQHRLRRGGGVAAESASRVARHRGLFAARIVLGSSGAALFLAFFVCESGPGDLVLLAACLILLLAELQDRTLFYVSHGRVGL